MAEGLPPRGRPSHTMESTIADTPPIAESIMDPAGIRLVVDGDDFDADDLAHLLSGWGLLANSARSFGLAVTGRPLLDRRAPCVQHLQDISVLVEHDRTVNVAFCRCHLSLL